MISYNLITALSMAGISAINAPISEDYTKHKVNNYTEISSYSSGILDCNLSCNGTCNGSCQG